MAKSITTVNPVRRSKLHKAALAAMAGAGYAPAEYEVVHVDLFGDGTAAVHFAKAKVLAKNFETSFREKRLVRTRTQRLVFSVPDAVASHYLPQG
jgi:hypothetical protein